MPWHKYITWLTAMGLCLSGCNLQANLSPINETATPALPAKVRLDVPFSPQAPFADWDDPRKQEGCEEMSLIMVHHFLEGSSLSRSQANLELLELSAWQGLNGYKLDVDIGELAVIANQYYGYETEVSVDVTVAAIKAALAAGHPVIVPAAGRRLGNPYFSGPGPWYHMLVITGYNSTHFITNDPGTKRGEGYKYEYDVLLNAVHDWTGVKEEIEQGRQVMLIVK